VNKRGTIIGVGTAVALAGLVGLGLVQTGVLPRPAPTENLLQTSPPAPVQDAPEQQAPAVETPPAGGGKSGQLPQPQVQSEPAATANEQAVESPVKVPKVGSGVRSYPKPQLPLPEPGRKERQKAVEPSRRKTYSTQARQAAPKPAREHYAESRSASGSPIVIRLQVDPRRQRGEINIARVHFGDRVVVKVRREYGADRQVYLTFGLPGRDERGGRYGRGARAGAVLTPVGDRDQLTLSSSRDFGPELTRRLSSRDGALLKLGTRITHESYSSPARPDRGLYEIEIKIYSENRWNIKPRSYL